MSRSNYLNGDEMGLSFGCDGCSPSMINGALCHETGRPEAWRDHKVECFECGFQFFPERASGSSHHICRGCIEDEEEDAVETYECANCGDECDPSELMDGMCPDCWDDDDGLDGDDDEEEDE